MERGTGGISCGEKVNWQRSGWQKEGVGGVVTGIKYKSTGREVNWRCRLFWVGWAGIGRRGQGDVSFRGLKAVENRPPRKLDWHLIVAMRAVVMGLGSVSRVPGSGVRVRRCSQKLTTASSLWNHNNPTKENDGGQTQHGSFGIITQARHRRRRGLSAGSPAGPGGRHHGR